MRSRSRQTQTPMAKMKNISIYIKESKCKCTTVGAKQINEKISIQRVQRHGKFYTKHKYTRARVGIEMLATIQRIFIENSNLFTNG